MKAKYKKIGERQTFKEIVLGIHETLDYFLFFLKDDVDKNFIRHFKSELSLINFLYNRMDFSIIEHDFKKNLLLWREWIWNEKDAQEMIIYKDMWE